MKRSLALMFVLFAFMFALTGCSRTQKVVATEGDLVTPYQSLGTIDVYEHAPRVSLKRGFQHMFEWLTFGLYDMPSQKTYLQGRLNEKLVKKAEKSYGAEAVIRVQYWPDLSAKKFPKGKIYARGEMIQYKRFA